MDQVYSLQITEPEHKDGKICYTNYFMNGQLVHITRPSVMTF